MQRTYFPPVIKPIRLNLITAVSVLLLLFAFALPTLFICVGVVAFSARTRIYTLASAVEAPAREWATAFWRGSVIFCVLYAAARSLAVPLPELGSKPLPPALLPVFWAAFALMGAALSATVWSDPGVITLDAAARAAALEDFLAHGAAPPGFDQVRRLTTRMLHPKVCHLPLRGCCSNGP